MTMMMHTLLRLHGDEDWQKWGDAWRNHADVITDLHFIKDRLWAPKWLQCRPHRQLDHGALMYEVTLAEIRELIGARPTYAHIREDWDQPFREREDRQNTLLATLPEDGRYAVVWIECY